MSADVECYAGCTYPEHPKALQWEGRRYEVMEILDRRREPDGLGFLVRCTPEEKLFDLFYSQAKDRWRIDPRVSALVDDSPHPISENEGD